MGITNKSLYGGEKNNKYRVKIIVDKKDGLMAIILVLDKEISQVPSAYALLEGLKGRTENNFGSKLMDEYKIFLKGKGYL